jgi:hypothetical protein
MVKSSALRVTAVNDNKRVYREQSANPKLLLPVCPSSGLNPRGQRPAPGLPLVGETPKRHKHGEQEKDAGRDRRLMAAQVKAKCQQHDS